MAEANECAQSLPEAPIREVSALHHCSGFAIQKILRSLLGLTARSSVDGDRNWRVRTLAEIQGNDVPIPVECHSGARQAIIVRHVSSTTGGEFASPPIPANATRSRRWRSRQSKQKRVGPLD